MDLENFPTVTATTKKTTAAKPITNTIITFLIIGDNRHNGWNEEGVIETNFMWLH